MIIRLTVHDPASGARHDLEATLDPESTVSSLLEIMPIRVGGRPCFVGRTLLDPDTSFANSPLVAGCTITVGAQARQFRVPDGAVGALQVISGPDAGVTAWLSPGSHVVGRAADASLQLHDHEASRRHVSIEVSVHGDLTVSDLGSSNGTSISGTRLETPTVLAPQTAMEVGGDVLHWIPLSAHRLRVSRSPDGRLDFDRAFAAAPAISRTEVALPSLPNTNRNIAGMLISGLAPLALGGVMAILLKQPAMLLFALLGPVTAFGSQFGERRQRKARQKAFATGKQAAAATISTAVETEERLRRAHAPDLTELTLAATGGGRGLWPRNADSPDGLMLRVGTADETPSIELRGEPWEGFEQPRLANVPVCLDLRRTGVLGVVGPPDVTAWLTRWLVVQLGVLRSPDDLRMMVITSAEGDDLAWTGWLPHVDAGEAGPMPAWIGNTPATRAARIEELKELVASRRAEQRAAGNVHFGEDVVVVLHGALALRHLPGMREVLRDGPSVNVYVICVDEQDMNECRGVCQVQQDTLWLTRSRDEHPLEVRPEGIDRDAAESVARALAPMRDRLTLAGGEAAIPFPVRYLDLVGMQAPDADAVLRHWGELPGLTTEVPLGSDAGGIVSVDLARQGPHTMLAGATGTGKSILLQTLVTSLLLANRPDELNMVLVDFKGGSAFLPFERCPHVVALIRSTGETPADVFDEAAAARVLASVRSEVSRRESMLARYGGEIDEYWRARSRQPGMAAMPRLVLIFDEFARVLEVSPDFLKELVNVAAKGRSLGMHLVLATQSLQGKLSAELKNNIDLRITLRQNEAADSTEVLGVPDAVAIPGRLRGRGMILCTKDEIRTPQLFQSGYLGNPPPSGGAPPARVRLVDWPALGTPRPEERASTGGAATDQDLTIAAIEEASAKLGLPAPFRPLLPPLPAELSLEDLPARATAAASSTAVEYGLIDDPTLQAQPEAALDLDGTDRLLIGGGPQSGRTTAVRALLTTIGTRLRPDEVQVYVLEHQPAGLADYEGLPHCGGVFSPAEPDRIRRFATWLDGEVQRRKVARFAAAAQPDARIVVIIDGWEHFENRSDPTFMETSLLTTLRGVVTAGPPLGVHVVAVGGQDMLNGKLPALYSRRLLLPFPKEDIRRGHLATGVVSPPLLPGRAVDAASGRHLQICTTTWTPERLVRAAQRATAKAGVQTARLPRPFPSLPVRIGLAELAVDTAPSPTWVPVGVGGPHVSTVGLDLFEAGPHLVLVSGPTESGRTTAAANLAHGLRRAGVGVLALCPPRSPLPRLLPGDDGVRVVTGTTVKDSDLRDAAAAFGEGRYAVIVDDCEQITLVAKEEGFTEAPTLLAEIAGPGALGRQALVMCGDALPILSGQRRSLMRVVNEMMTAGTRMLLSPAAPLIAREQGFMLEPDQFFAGPPGRGYLTIGRNAELVQLATPGG